MVVAKLPRKVMIIKEGERMSLLSGEDLNTYTSHPLSRRKTMCPMGLHAQISSQLSTPLFSRHLSRSGPNGQSGKRLELTGAHGFAYLFNLLGAEGSD